MHYYEETNSDTNVCAISNENLNVFCTHCKIDVLFVITYQFVLIHESITVGLDGICSSLYVKIELDISILLRNERYDS